MNLSAMNKLALEMAVYGIASRYVESYAGGSWRLTKEDYWLYKDKPKVKLVNVMNYFSDEMSSTAASIALSIMACCLLWERTGSDIWGQHRERLMNLGLDTLQEEDKTKFIKFLD